MNYNGGSNTDGARNVTVTTTKRDYEFFRKLPAAVRNFLMYDCNINISAENTYAAFVDLGTAAVLSGLRNFSRDDHIKAHGGQYPSDFGLT